MRQDRAPAIASPESMQPNVLRKAGAMIVHILSAPSRLADTIEQRLGWDQLDN